MKIFKTILWTSFFWILVVGGFRVASLWSGEVTWVFISLLPNSVYQSVYSIGYQNGKLDPQAECSSLEESIALETVAPNYPVSSEEIGEDAELLQAKVLHLEQNLAVLESNFKNLVGELNAIFSTPQGQQLLPQQDNQETVAPVESSPIMERPAPVPTIMPVQ